VLQVGQGQRIQRHHRHLDPLRADRGEIRIVLGEARPLLLRHAVQHGDAERQPPGRRAQRLHPEVEMRRDGAVFRDDLGAQPGEGGGQRLEGQHAGAGQASEGQRQQPVMRADIEDGAGAVQARVEGELVHDPRRRCCAAPHLGRNRAGASPRAEQA
jgi:hypothetical protein